MKDKYLRQAKAEATGPSRQGSLGPGVLRQGARAKLLQACTDLTVKSCQRVGVASWGRGSASKHHLAERSTVPEKEQAGLDVGDGSNGLQEGLGLLDSLGQGERLAESGRADGGPQQRERPGGVDLETSREKTRVHRVVRPTTGDPHLAALRLRPTCRAAAGSGQQPRACSPRPGKRRPGRRRREKGQWPLYWRLGVQAG